MCRRPRCARHTGRVCWSVSPVLRVKTASLFPPYRLYEPTNEPTSIEIRYQYWRKSIEFIRQAPLTGHGTGSIRTSVAQAAINQTNVLPRSPTIPTIRR